MYTKLQALSVYAPGGFGKNNIVSSTYAPPPAGLRLAIWGAWKRSVRFWSKERTLKTLMSFKHIREASFAVLSVILLGTVIVLSSCSQKESFLASGSSQFIVQDLNPPYLDILWVLDDRSPMTLVRDHLISEASNFFVRLDSIPSNYQMGITTMDMLRNRGALRPAGTILTKRTGSLSERLHVFETLLSQIINLQTGAENTGFAATLLALNNQFKPRAGVPLVLVFISDGDDFSDFRSVTAQDPVDFFAAQVLSLKGGKEELVKAYAINYVPLTSSTSVSDVRCATRNNADVDKAGTGAVRSDGSPWFQNRYFRLAAKLKGDSADLCSSFSSRIDLSGLRLKTLATRFRVDQTVSNPSLLRVSITSRTGESLNIAWTFDATTNEVVFSTAPPEGASIQILVASN
ncbi:MAG: hypothetical protein EBQ92_10800 [Proteobacteria bacterium]|nr:hypothetical protein [Pseudomonadota bacterium]